MGSIDKACISGFLCRLCSEMHRTVIHIYGDQGQRLCLVEKINGYLPITISPTDPLPKTICTTCLRRVEQHYALLMKLTKIREERRLKLKQLARTDVEYTSSTDCSDEETANRNDPSQQQTHDHKVNSTTTHQHETRASTSSNGQEMSSSSSSSISLLRRSDISATPAADPTLQVVVSNNIME